ncbi:molybdopterin-dependent oxidoreductase [Mycobacterium sp. MBM]|nr:molybdopterin-dependent oxidoreductase [Mycobacterium sp. MBM]
MSDDHQASRRVRFNCFLCASCCGMYATVEGDRITGVTADRDHPVSRGYSCTKGRNIPQVHHAPHRLNRPRISGVEVEWPEFLDDLAGRLKALRDEFGPDSIAKFSGTGTFAVNELFAMHTFFGMIGTKSLYSALTLDVAPLMRAAELVTGFTQAVPVWTPEEPQSTLTVVVGQNPAVSGGYVGTPATNFTARLREFRKRGGEVWTIDPRATRTARMSDRHLAVRPGSDVFIFGWLARELLSDGFDEAELTQACDPQDVDRLRSVLEAFDLATVARRTGLDETSLTELLGAIRRHGRVSLLPGTGISFSPDAVVTYWLIWVVGILTGSLDRRGGMRFLPASAAMMNGPQWKGHAPEGGSTGPGPASRPELGQIFTERPSVAMVDEIEAGNIRALIVVGADPLGAAPDAERLRAALATLDVLVVVDVLEWELTETATHVAPCTWQTERNDMRFLPQHGFERAYVSNAIVEPATERRHVWQLLSDVGSRMGLDILSVLPGVDSETVTDRGLMRAVSRLTCDDAEAVFEAGVDGRDVDFRYGWFHEKVLPGGRWRLAPRVLTERVPELLQRTDRQGPRLISGRTLESVNSSHYGVLKGVPNAAAAPSIRLSADLARDREIATGDRIRVSTVRGEVVGEVLVDASMASGTVWIAHGWHSRNVNLLTDPHPDPLTGQPSVTAVPVNVERVC